MCDKWTEECPVNNTYIKGNEANIKQIRQCEGGGILVWAMVMPNGLISEKIVRQTFKSLKPFFKCI